MVLDTDLVAVKTLQIELGDLRGLLRRPTRASTAAADLALAIAQDGHDYRLDLILIHAQSPLYTYPLWVSRL
jgi:hypothetical protein